jgi:hypothetical protein
MRNFKDRKQAADLTRSEVVRMAEAVAINSQIQTPSKMGA